MTRLERYKNILIPVDEVAYVEYRKSNKNSWSSDDDGGTYVHIQNGCLLSPLKIGKKNLLDDFKKWYDETMNRIGRIENYVGNYFSSYPGSPVRVELTTSEGGGIDVVSPSYCQTSTTSDGNSVVTIMGGHTSSEPSYVKCDDKSHMMVQHDGIEHPL